MTTPLDMDLVTELRDIMADGFVALVDSFQRDTEQRLADIREACVAGEYERLRQLAHSLKGSSGNLGAREVAAACLAIENALKEGQTAQLGALVDTLVHSSEVALQALRALVP